MRRPRSAIALGATNGEIHNLVTGVITANVPLPLSGTALARLQGDLVNDGTLEVFNRAAFLAGTLPSTLTNNGSIELAAGSATDTEQTITNATGG